MKKKQKKQAELLEKRIQEIEGGAAPDGGEEEDNEETEANEDTASSATLFVSATLQDSANHTSTGERVDPGPKSDISLISFSFHCPGYSHMPKIQINK